MNFGQGKNVLAQIYFSSLFYKTLKVKEKVSIRIHFIVLAKPAVNPHVYSYLVYSCLYVFVQSYC